MPASRPGQAKGTSAPVAPAASEPPWDEVDRCFREFRESAVRLVERVNDLLGSNGPRGAPSPKDLRLVRSVFGKWSTEVLVVLHTAPSVGFEELRRALPGISPRVAAVKIQHHFEAHAVRPVSHIDNVFLSAVATARINPHSKPQCIDSFFLQNL